MLRIKVAQKNDLAPGKGMLVEAQGKKIALFNIRLVANLDKLVESENFSLVETSLLGNNSINGEFYAIDDLCRHAGASLSQGTVEGKVVKCPKHGATFDIFTGKALTSPALEDVKCYKVSVEGDDVCAEVPDGYVLEA